MPSAALAAGADADVAAGATGHSPALWCDLTAASSSDYALLASVLQAEVAAVLVAPLAFNDVALPPRVAVCCFARTADDVEAAVARGAIVAADSAELMQQARARGARTALVSHVHDAGSLGAAVRAIGSVDYVVARLHDETNIPLELLLAEAHGTATKIVKWVSSPEDVAATVGVLERGPHAVLVSAETAADLGEAAGAIARGQEETLGLHEAIVSGTRHIGMGFRACVDAATLFDLDEGMVVGSTSTGGVLVCAEVHHLPYMNLRPFRVNAGAVHSYAWVPQGRTAYLTDLSVGERALAVRTDGRARPVVIGRVKMEVRPLRVIEAVIDGATVNVVVQDDWHVRIFDADGRARNCTDIRKGDRLLGLLAPAARHVGIEVSEAVTEQ